MLQVAQEIDVQKRQDIYYEIQEYIIEDLVPCLVISSPYYYRAHSIHLENIPQTMKYYEMYYFPCTWMGVEAIINDPLQEACGELEKSWIDNISGFNILLFCGIGVITVVNLKKYIKRRKM